MKLCVESVSGRQPLQDRVTNLNNKALAEPFGALGGWLLIQFGVFTVHSNQISCEVLTPFPTTYFCKAAFYKHKTADQETPSIPL